ncbi:MAG: trypsin-like peptidase domain-containing protein [Oscillospiraceae bacterium]|nr:trypsin-like peptidase domain-containing protein [Oscillospiraceae bacterium]
MKNSKSLLTRVFVTALVVCMLACFLLPTAVLAASEKVNQAKYGVLQVNLVYTDDNNSNNVIASGTGFLVNDNTLVTCYHVVNLDEGELEYLAQALGKTVAEIKSRLSVSVTVSRDVTIGASTLTESFEMDFAVLRLSSSLQGKTPLQIRSSDTVQQAETVYAIGFPDTSMQLQTINTYTSDDATITQGIINKIGTGVNLYSGANTHYIQTSCNLDYGNSGGPMVDENGYVIGVSQGVVGDDVTEYYNAVAVNQVTEVLDALGIIYTAAGAVEEEPVEEEPVEEEPVEKEPVVEEPVEVLPPVEEPVEALPPIEVPEAKGPNMTLILIIAAVVVVIIVVVVVVVILTSGKSKPAAAPVPAPAAARPVPPAPSAGFAPTAPTYPAQGAGETTVLSSSAGETTVLSRNAVNGGTLTRKRTGETITINADNFVIGRERKGSNYCIADNSSVSRSHVKLSVRGGVTYLTDLGAANGTFVNGVKVVARQEVALKNGDKITLADEDLEYKN